LTRVIAMKPVPPSPIPLPCSYKVCPFGSASQDSTSLGTFSGWGAAAAGSSGGEGGGDYGLMKFTGGQTCWNGPARSLTLTLVCGAEDAVSAFSEPEKCTYAATLTTPAACDGRATQALRLDLDADEEGGGGGTSSRDAGEL
jgi:protein kinase C substrate 80K-H